MAKNDGGPAYPCEWTGTHSCGMSIRDVMATAAMQGIMASTSDDMGCEDILETKTEIVATAYAIADEMLRVSANTGDEHGEKA